MSFADLQRFAVSRRAPIAVGAPTPTVRLTDEAHRATLGVGVREDDFRHATLVVREAPRLGATLADDAASDRLRRYLESIDLRPRVPTGRIVFATDDFLMDSFVESDAERFTPVYNFATPVVQTAHGGRQPRMYQYQGSLLRSAIEGSSYAAFRAGWDAWLRATKLVAGVARRDVPYVVELSYLDQLRRGYPVAVQFDRPATPDSRVGFALTLFVVHEASRETEAARGGVAAVAVADGPGFDTEFSA